MKHPRNFGHVSPLISEKNGDIHFLVLRAVSTEIPLKTNNNSGRVLDVGGAVDGPGLPVYIVYKFVYPFKERFHRSILHV